MYGFGPKTDTLSYIGGGVFTMISGLDNWELTVHAVPEPATAVLLAVGGVALAGVKRRRRG